MKVKYLLRYIYLTQKIDIVDDLTNEVLKVDYYKPRTYDKWEVEAITATDKDTIEIRVRNPQITKEMRNAFCYQRAYEKAMKELKPFEDKAAEIWKDLKI